MQKLLSIFLFSNSLYGVAAVLLAVEHNRKLGLPLNHPLFYLMLYCGTVAFYLFSYQYDPHPLKGNRRAMWIGRNKKPLLAYRNLLTLTGLAAGIVYAVRLPHLPLATLAGYLAGLALFPLLGIFYYGVSFPGLFHIRLRQFGWFKPFTIGAVWVGCVCLMPWILAHWEHYPADPPGKTAYYFVWMHDWMYISVLCILFDIKDYAADHNHHLKTFVVRVGLRALIFRIVIPLVFAGTAALVYFMLRHQFSPFTVLLNLVPMAALLWVTQSLKQRRSIAYFLAVIDGLMVVKAVFGILSLSI